MQKGSKPARAYMLLLRVCARVMGRETQAFARQSEASKRKQAGALDAIMSRSSGGAAPAKAERVETRRQMALN